MRNELYARNPKTIQKLYLFCIQILDTAKYKALAPCHVSKKKKRKTENGNPTAHLVYAKHFCNMLVLYGSTAARPS